MKRSTCPREVTAFEEARSQVHAFAETHPRFMREYELLIETYNQTLQAADHVCRAEAVEGGPWRLINRQVRYDAERLAHHVGRERFMELGGAIENAEHFSIEPHRVATAIRAGEISRCVVSEIRTITPKYQSPKLARLP